MNWENNLSTADPEVLDIAQSDWDECRAYFGRETVCWADALRVAAFGGAEGGGSCGHGARFLLPVELLLEMPGPLATALAGVPLELPEGPWPNWARTDHPIDWPALITADPEHLTWSHEMLAANMGASGDGVAAAYRLLDAYELDPRIDAILWLEVDGRFSVEPAGLFADSAIDPALTRQVDDILVDGGRPRDRLHEGRESGFWLLDA
ncbi:hypothetical protein [Nocardia testacea]|uniref:hypothetical protein n=1 Tax=Nocardia testacea TaxID=248551 RepID=UPI003A840945